MSEIPDPLSLTPGTVLQMQATVPETAPRYSTRLIGSLPGASLIVATPTVNGNVQIIREGQRFRVRALKGEHVLGFVAQVLLSTMKPYPHLHLEFPESVEQIVVRNGTRVSAEVPAKARHTDQPNEASSFADVTLVDLSETGAKIASNRQLAANGEPLHLKFTLSISGVDDELGVLGDVRNVSKRAEAAPDGGDVLYYTGVKFRKLSRFQQVLLHAWVSGQMLENALNSRGGW